MLKGIKKLLIKEELVCPLGVEYNDLYKAAQLAQVHIPGVGNGLEKSFLNWMKTEGLLNIGGTGQKNELSNERFNDIISKALSSRIYVPGIVNGLQQTFVCWLASTGYLN